MHCYFDNVGGDVSEAVVAKMAKNGHVILCGQISQYNKNVPYPPPISSEMEGHLSEKSITRERFTVINYTEDFQPSLTILKDWLSQGKLQTRENIVVGLENAGKAFVDMMNGCNIGKQIVKL